MASFGQKSYLLKMSNHSQSTKEFYIVIESPDEIETKQSLNRPG
jgi:hypothetical protein